MRTPNYPGLKIAGILALGGVICAALDLIGVAQTASEVIRFCIWLGPWVFWPIALVVFIFAEGPVIQDRLSGRARLRRVLAERLREGQSLTLETWTHFVLQDVKKDYKAWEADWMERSMAWVETARKSVEEVMSPSQAVAFMQIGKPDSGVRFEDMHPVAIVKKNLGKYCDVLASYIDTARFRY